MLQFLKSSFNKYKHHNYHYAHPHQRVTTNCAYSLVVQPYSPKSCSCPRWPHTNTWSHPAAIPPYLKTNNNKTARVSLKTQQVPTPCLPIESTASLRLPSSSRQGDRLIGRYCRNLFLRPKRGFTLYTFELNGIYSIPKYILRRTAYRSDASPYCAQRHPWSDRSCVFLCSWLF